MKAHLALATTLLPVLFVGCARPDAGPTAAAATLPPVRVRVFALQAETVPATTTITGTVRPIQRARVAAKMMGAIEELPVTLGQRVNRGDVLVRIAAGEIQARVAQARAQLSAANRELERERSLLAPGASTADLVKGLEDRQAAAAAVLREAEVMLGYATVRAPFDGVVARKLVETGDLATPGATLLEVDGIAGWEVEAGVPDSLAASLAIGAPVSVDLPAVGVSLTGRLAEISSAAETGARTVTVKVALPEHGAIRAGQFARVQLQGQPVSVLLVPSAAVSDVGQMERVFVAEDNRAKLRLVKTGARRGERTEILAGLDVGERVVIGAPATLRENQPLEVQP